MKKFNFLLTSIFSLTAGALISCSLISEIKNYEMPQKVSINTTGKYTVPLGDATARFRGLLIKIFRLEVKARVIL